MTMCVMTDDDVSRSVVSSPLNDGVWCVSAGCTGQSATHVCDPALLQDQAVCGQDRWQDQVHVLHTRHQLYRHQCSQLLFGPQRYVCPLGRAKAQAGSFCLLQERGL